MGESDAYRLRAGAHVPLYTFHRAEGFYPLELHGGDAEAIANAEHNPGTLRVEHISGRVVWRQQ